MTTMPAASDDVWLTSPQPAQKSARSKTARETLALPFARQNISLRPIQAVADTHGRAAGFDGVERDGRHPFRVGAQECFDRFVGVVRRIESLDDGFVEDPHVFRDLLLQLAVEFFLVPVFVQEIEVDALRRKEVQQAVQYAHACGHLRNDHLGVGAVRVEGERVGRGLDALDLLQYCLLVVKKIERVVFALAHLGGPVEAGQAQRLAADGLRHVERVAEAAVETLGDVARHLDVLTLVIADGHLVRLHDEDIRRHEHGVAEEAKRQRVALGFRVFLVLGHLVLVGGAAFEEADVGDHAEEQRKLGGAWQIALPVDDGPPGIETACNIGAQHGQRFAVDIAPLLDGRERVVIGDEVVTALARFLKLNEIADGAEIVAVMQAARRADTRKDDFFFGGHNDKSSVSSQGTSCRNGRSGGYRKRRRYIQGQKRPDLIEYPNTDEHESCSSRGQHCLASKLLIPIRVHSWFYLF